MFMRHYKNLKKTNKTLLSKNKKRRYINYQYQCLLRIY